MKRLVLTIIISLVTLCCYAQSGRVIYGCVYDKHLTPIKGAKISTTSGELICVTDENGQFHAQTSSYLVNIVISHNDFHTSKESVDGSYMTIKLRPLSVDVRAESVDLRAELEQCLNSTDDPKLIKRYNSILNPKWGLGLRVGGISVLNWVGYYNVTKRSYAQIRFGLALLEGICPDFTALYNLRIVNAEWTPSVGSWFFDAGVGINAGGHSSQSYVGAALMARLGINLYKAPITLSFDYTPSIGKGSYDYSAYGRNYHKSEFNLYGLINFGITCTYNF